MFPHPRIPASCAICTRHPASAFCALPDPGFTALQAVKVPHTYPRGTTLFMEGEHPRGVYLLCSGRAKMSTCSEDGKTIILRIAEPGEVLGLGAVFANTVYENTAQTIEESTVGFIDKRDFLHLIETHHGAALAALRQLVNNYYKAYSQICSLGLSASAGDKLARLLLQWCDQSANGTPEVHIRRSYTHSEIAEMIGCSRETVTRLLGEFKDRELIDLSRTELVVRDRKRLKASIGTRFRNGNGHL
jgi:CRP/FNR family transcriptional regulator, cyclic AMP receptor protein